jgi:peroxiredoxin
MRSLFLTLFILIAAAANAQDSVKLSGKILNPASDSLHLIYNDNIIAYYPKEFFATVDKQGNFSINFPVPSGIYLQVEVMHGKKLAEILVRSGDSLFLTVDALHFDSTIHYTGRGSEVENFIDRHTLVNGRMNQYSIKLKTAINGEPAIFVKSIAKEQKAELDFLEKNRQGLPPAFIRYWTAFYQYYNYFFIQQYPQIHEMVKHRKFTDTVPPENYAVVKEMAYAFNDSLLAVPSYLLYLTGVIDIKLKAAGYVYLGADQKRKQVYEDSAYTLARKLLPNKSAEYFIAQNLYGRARNQSLERTRSQFKAFKKRWPASKFLPPLSAQVALTERLAPGQPAPDFQINTPDGKSIRLSDLKGKVVYLGFWAAWCKQCIAEIAAEKKIKDLITNKPLEFVYISITGDTAADNKVINKLKTDGRFTASPGIWTAKEVELFGVQSLPAYFLIDEDGNFALQPPPPPTQSTQLILEIEKLFK